MVQKDTEMDPLAGQSVIDEEYPFWLRAPFRLLTDVTQFRKIDPWSLEIDQLITRFVEEMKLRDDINFPVLGRAVLSSSILYRAKVTDLIKIIEQTDEKDESLDVMGFDIPEISPSYHLSQRPVSFSELVFAFEGLLKQESRYKHRLAISKGQALIKPLQLPPTPVQIVDVETTKIARLKREIYERLVKLHLQNKRPIFFEELLLPNSTRITVIRAFLCLLFLGFELKAKLFQDVDQGRITLLPIRDNEEEFLGGLEKVIERKLQEGVPTEGSVSITEIADDDFLEETDLLFDDDFESDTD